jgi:hypothetical protein
MYNILSIGRASVCVRSLGFLSLSLFWLRIAKGKPRDKLVDSHDWFSLVHEHLGMKYLEPVLPNTCTISKYLMKVRRDFNGNL